MSRSFTSRMLGLWIAICSVLLTAGISQAQTSTSLVGDWRGVLTTPGGDLIVTVRIAEKDGTLSGEMATPEHPEGGITPLSVTASDQGKLVLSAGSINASFTGSWDEATHSWTGSWTQSGFKLPLVLRRASESVAVIKGLDGTWNGGVERDGRTFRMVLHVKTSELGTILKFDALDAGATDLQTSEFTRDGDRVRFTVPAAGARFDGNLSPSGDRLTGTWAFPGRPIANVEFVRTSATALLAPPSRPQTPAAPFPYAIEDVRFVNPQAVGVTIAGTLTMPPGKGPFPAVVLVSGSGQQDRDESMFGHKPFAVLADYLSRRGVAVFRYDDRGVGGSTGSFAASTPEDFASDTRAAVSYLSRRAGIKARAIGLIGHSEGGLVSAIAASGNQNVGFLVLLASPGVPMRQVLLDQRRVLAVLGGATDEQLARSQPVIAKILDAIGTARSDADAETRMRAILANDGAASLPMSEGSRELFIQQMARSGIRRSLFADPSTFLSKVRVPVLAMDGTLDRQVIADTNLAAIRAALSRNSDVSVRSLVGLNHFFQTAKTGAISEYEDLSETFSPPALAMISGWIRERFAR